MKVLIIGDRHGQDFGRDYLDQYVPEYDLVVFMGDWFDSYNFTFEEQVDVFKKDMSYRSEGNVVYLWGNHDLQYLPYRYEYSHLMDDIDQCTGFQNNKKFAVSELLGTHDKYFDFLHAEGKILFSHAGMTQFLYDKVCEKYQMFDIPMVQELSNKEFPTELFDSTYGLTWIRPDKLISDPLEGYTQVIGHTNNSDLIWYTKNLLNVDCRRLIELDTDKMKTRYVNQ